ncbi:hypothetical protein LSTR_LSTR015692 [Laodelphax striatellus]|uniref:Uncharacterized protein n=1 Tax=Laodelphax striatellus TaxID=195883 RepID=A0A482XHF6_LAOST|nr:hypothetical protein LSTR_LSTR015692 [Laodelphax striatellus]
MYEGGHNVSAREMSDAKEQSTLSSSKQSVASSRTVPQMFGIYRARTPDAAKLDAVPPGRHTRALFLSAVVTGVALVVGLTLLDVSTNSSNLKSTPVLHLTRHRQDLFVVEAKTSEAPDIQGIVEEINDTASESSVTEVVNITEVVTIEEESEGIKDESKNNEKVRTARTHLFPIESLKRHRTQYVKDYFVDGKHDPQSLGYYILQKQNGEYYLRNYSEPMWGTRIRRRFSNRMYPPQPLGTDPYQFARRSDNFDTTRYHYYGGPPRIDRLRRYPIDRQDHGRKNLQTMTTLRKYFNPYSKRVETGLPQTYSGFGRSDRPFAPTPNTEGQDKDNTDSPSYYQFTPIPVFSDAYAQLDPYKNNREIKSMKDIVKYLTTSTSLPKLERTTTTQATITSLETFQNEQSKKEEENFEDLLTTSSAAKVTRLKPPSNANFNWKDTTYQPPKRINRKRGMRISGSYRMPIEPEDLRTGASGLVETLVPPPMHPFMYIANSTEPDPFAKFRPLDPSEINQLAVPKPSRPPGSMFMNNIRPSGKPNQYFPKPSHDRDRIRQGISLNPNHSPSHTVALFKPNGSSGRQKYHQSSSGKKKPVSVTLDIYPMTMNEQQDYNQDEATGLPSKYDDKPLNDEWSPRHPDTTNQQMDSQGSENHMVVHLNVFPKGITSNLRSGIGRQAFWNPPLPIAAYQKRAMSDSNTTAYSSESPVETNNSSVIEDDILDAPFLEYDFDDLPPASYEEDSDKKKTATTNNENVATSNRTKGENNGTDNDNSISSQGNDSAFNRTDNYSGVEFGDEENHKTESSIPPASERQSEDSSSENINTLGESSSVESNEKTSSADSTHKNFSHLSVIDNVAALKDDNRFVESSTKPIRYQYRLITAHGNNISSSVSDFNHVATVSSVKVVKNFDDSNHKLTHIASKLPVSNDYQEHKVVETYDYDLNDAPTKDEYQDYFADEGVSHDYQEQ